MFAASLIGLVLIVGICFILDTAEKSRMVKSREKAIAKELSIDVKDFAVITSHVEVIYFNFKEKIDYYSGDNRTWIIVTKEFRYEVLFKGNTDHVIYVRKTGRVEAFD
ncbi:hypothetical protein [Carnobacterium divergens]|uniref:hypothetical protein n=1 Tax=Carnobacterium divergens TaxID=2748 RepID=UPI00288F2BE5|nr:hypothetical protein [Carnobacterium divergens]MDT2010819.1 hypothetical protein [Carnobacterium divergens]